MTQQVTYHPEREPGGTGQQGGDEVQYVDAETFYLRFLGGEVMNATVVFFELHSDARLSADQRHDIDDALADAYWNTYEGVLTPPMVLRTLREAAVGPSGEVVIDLLERARQDLFDADPLSAAAEVHSNYRMQYLMKGAERFLTELQVSVAEVMTDYLLLQRAIAEDIRRAESGREEGETRADVLQRMDENADLRFEDMLGRVLQPDKVVEMLPDEHRPEVESFARRRQQHYREGVLSVPGEDG